MKLKKLILFTISAYILYLVAGITLAATGHVSKVYFLPGWSIKAPHYDQSAFEADGPIVLYHEGTAMSLAIVPSPQGLIIQKDTLSLSVRQPLRCYVSVPHTSFSVKLHTIPMAEPSIYPTPARLLAISDIEGNFKGLSLLLQHTGVIDSSYHWRFGSGHLVVVGDVFDRGTQVTECLWLLYQLDQEATQMGGKMHLILGNHEIMNLTGKYKYVRQKYRHDADSLNLPYSRWYGPDSELGRWLRSKNVAERIGSTLFVHGGISPVLAAYHLTLPELNARARQLIDTPTRHSLTGLDKLIGNSDQSPDWYRGLALEQDSPQYVSNLLATYEAKRLVIGHTLHEEITPLYGAKILAIDMPHEVNTQQGVMKALWIENDTYMAIRTDSHQRQRL